MEEWAVFRDIYHGRDNEFMGYGSMMGTGGISAFFFRRRLNISLYLVDLPSYSDCSGVRYHYLGTCTYLGIMIHTSIHYRNCMEVYITRTFL